MSTQELKPCPFCNSTAQINDNVDTTIVFCINCYANIRKYSYSINRLEEVVSAWNQRVVSGSCKENESEL